MIEQGTVATGILATPPETSEGSTWATKWDMWWRRVMASGGLLLILDQVVLNLRAANGSSWEVKFEIAAPLVICVSTAIEVWRARRANSIEQKLAESIITALLFALWFTYNGMSEIRHLSH